jgi:hypothetical protein
MIGVVERQKAVGITALLAPEKVAAAFRRAGFHSASRFYAMIGVSKVRHSVRLVRRRRNGCLIDGHCGIAV